MPGSLFDRLLAWVRRTLLVVFGVPIAFGVVLTLVDAIRRRGRKSPPLPRQAAREVEVGQVRIATYTYGQDLYDEMLAAIRGARKQILLETYIWKGDQLGERFKAALIEAAARGVDVYVIFDGFANLVVAPRFKRFPPEIRTLPYPVYTAGWRFFDLRRYGRDHRKILVVDDEVAFVGGYNIGSTYATEWRDTHCKVTGPAVWDLKRAFADFWNLHRRRRIGRSARPLLLDTVAEWEPRIRLHRNVPRLWMFPIRSMYLEAINRAERNVWLTHAYFLPDQDFVDELKQAAARGVDVRLLLPGRCNHIVADWVSRGYYGQLLSAGVQIHRFRDAMVHAKTGTIDGTWATIGTANIDRLSLSGNYEINLEIIDPNMAKVMEEIFEADLANSERITLAAWEGRNFYRRFSEFILKPLRPLL